VKLLTSYVNLGRNSYDEDLIRKPIWEFLLFLADIIWTNQILKPRFTHFYVSIVIPQFKSNGTWV
jgi:hypothetical protein